MTLPAWLELRVADLRVASRVIRRTPAASAVIVLSLALGIGANTAIFSIADTLLLKRLPVRSPQELYLVAQRGPAGSARPTVVWSYPAYRGFREGSRALAGVAAHTGPQTLGFQADGEGGADRAYGAFVSGNYFEVLGVGAAAGRLLTAQDDARAGGAPYVVMSDDFWQRRFGRDPGVIGRSIRVNGYPLTVVGVTARGFHGTDVATSPNLFIPVAMRTEVFGVPVSAWTSPSEWWLQITGRLAPGAAVSQAAAELSAVQRASIGQGQGGRQRDIDLLPASRGYSTLRNRLETPLVVLAAIVGMVLFIACANVAGLLLARGATRDREMAVRLATGASRGQLASQLLMESGLLGLMGGGAGLLVAYPCVQALLAFVPRFGGLQASVEVTPDPRVLGFTFLVSLMTGLLSGLAPALQSTRPDIVSSLKARTSEGRGHARIALRKGIVVGQVALSLLLVLAASLFVRTLQNLQRVDLGMQPGQTLLVRVDPTRNGYTGPRLRDFYERLRADVERLPGVRAASLARTTPRSASTVSSRTPCPAGRGKSAFDWRWARRATPSSG